MGAQSRRETGNTPARSSDDLEGEGPWEKGRRKRGALFFLLAQANQILNFTIERGGCPTLPLNRGEGEHERARTGPEDGKTQTGPEGEKTKPARKVKGQNGPGRRKGKPALRR